MQSFQSLKLTGSTLSTKDGVLLIDGKPLNENRVEIRDFDEEQFLTKTDAKRLYSVDQEALIAGLYPSSNPNGFISEADMDSFATKNDFEEFKATALADFKKLNSKLVKKHMAAVEGELKKSPNQEELTKSYSIYDQLEAIIEAFNGKPQNLDKIKKSLLKIKSGIS